jgi:hypothetical protein
MFLWLKVFVVLYILFLITVKLIRYFRGYPTLNRVLLLQNKLRKKATLTGNERLFVLFVTIGELKAARRLYREVLR